MYLILSGNIFDIPMLVFFAPRCVQLVDLGGECRREESVKQIIRKITDDL
jgi:hypothetical protein